MDPIEAGIHGIARRTPRRAPRKFRSSPRSTGAPARGESLDAAYWWRNIREPVRFADAVRHLRDGGHAVFVEISPRPILGGYLAESVGAGLRDCRILPTMAQGGDGLQALRRRAFEVVIAGCTTDFSSFFPATGAVRRRPGLCMAARAPLVRTFARQPRAAAAQDAARPPRPSPARRSRGMGKPARRQPPARLRGSPGRRRNPLSSRRVRRNRAGRLRGTARRTRRARSRTSPSMRPWSSIRSTARPCACRWTRMTAAS